MCWRPPPPTPIVSHLPHPSPSQASELESLRAQNITWSTDNKAKRSEARVAQAELRESKEAHAALASQASMWEERAHKLQEEVKLRSELATMWKRSAEKGGGGERGELEAAALTWKVEAERATSEGVAPLVDCTSEKAQPELYAAAASHGRCPANQTAWQMSGSGGNACRMSNARCLVTRAISMSA